MKDSVQRFIDRRENRILERKRRKDELEGEKLSHFNNEHPRTMQKGHEGEFTAKNKAEGLSREDKERDSKYRKAIERNDIQEAQRLVDEAAQKAGYNLSAYHGTKSDFTQFQMGREGIHLGSIEQAEVLTKPSEWGDKEPFYFSEVKSMLPQMSEKERLEIAKQAYEYIYDDDHVEEIYPNEHNVDVSDPDDVIRYVYDVFGSEEEASESVFFVRKKTNPHIMSLYAKINNPYVIEKDILSWTPENIANVILKSSLSSGSGSKIKITPQDMVNLNSIRAGLKSGDSAWEQLKSILGKSGYDGIQYFNEYEGDTDSEYNYSYIALSPNDVKSANPIVKDEEGRVIMPSERFNISSPDTRGHGNVSNERKAKRIGNREKRKRQYL